MQVVGRLARRRVLMEGLVRRQHERQVPVEELAESDEPALEPVAARSPASEDRVHRLAEVRRQLTDQSADEHLQGEPLAPERRAGTPRGLGHLLERQPVPAALS
jgi:hypothetical protein